MKPKISIDQLPVNSIATIVGYNKIYGGYIGKLTIKGLTAGKSFELLDISDTEIFLKIHPEGNTVILTKPEADALYVTAID